MRLKPVLFYTLAFLIAFYASLLLLFPKQRAVSFFQGVLSSLSPNLNVSIGGAGLDPLLHLDLKEITVLLGDTIRFSSSSAAVFVDPVSIKEPEKKITVETGFHGGVLDCRLGLTRLSPPAASRINLEMKNAQVKDLNYRTQLAEIRINCIADGTYTSNNDQESFGAGRGEILLRNFSAEMKDSLFNRLNLSEVGFTTVKIEYERKQKVLDIKKCIARGPVINVSLKGTIETGFPLQSSRLSMAGSILPDSPYLAKFKNLAVLREKTADIASKGVAFDVTGTLGHPEIGI